MAQFTEDENEIDIDTRDIDSIHECFHIFQDGNSCMNVAGPGEPFCRWHTTAADREKRRISYVAKRRDKKAIPDLNIKTIEDPESLQIAIHEIMDAIIDGRLTDRRAGWLLYSLQLSSTNVKRKLHFSRMNYSVFNLIEDLEEHARDEKQRKLEAAERRASKKRPQSIKLTEVDTAAKS